MFRCIGGLRERGVPEDPERRSRQQPTSVRVDRHPAAVSASCSPNYANWAETPSTSWIRHAYYAKIMTMVLAGFKSLRLGVATRLRSTKTVGKRLGLGPHRLEQHRSQGMDAFRSFSQLQSHCTIAVTILIWNYVDPPVV